MPQILTFLVVLLAGRSLLQAQQTGRTQPRAPSSSCYQYQRDTIALVGRVTWRVYPGRPNYDSVERGDQADTVIILRLDCSLCTVASEVWDPHDQIGEVQLVLSQNDYRAALRLANARLTLTGTLRGADFGWHHLPVLFQTRLPPFPRRTEGG